MILELEPSLEECIQTLAKREYERLVRSALESGDLDEETAGALEALKDFLEKTDFPRLRSRYEPYLAEGKRVRFLLRLQGGYSLEMRVE